MYSRRDSVRKRASWRVGIHASDPSTPEEFALGFVRRPGVHIGATDFGCAWVVLGPEYALLMCARTAEEVVAMPPSARRRLSFEPVMLSPERVGAILAGHGLRKASGPRQGRQTAVRHDSQVGALAAATARAFHGGGVVGSG